MRRLLFLMLLLVSDFATAQERPFYKKIKNIDSLIDYSQIDIAKIKIDSLHRVYTKLKIKNGNSKNFLIEIKFRQAVLLSKQNRPPANLLQKLLEIKDEAEEADMHALSYQINLLIMRIKG